MIIDTEWNLKDVGNGATHIERIVIIDTEWNLKVVCEGIAWVIDHGDNRYRMEFKVSLYFSVKLSDVK